MLDQADLSARQRHRYLVTYAIHCWLGNDVAGCDGFIAKASEVSVVTGGQNLDRNLYVYETYLAALLEYRRQHAALYQKEEAEPLHIIGESHCLSPHGIAVQIGEASFRLQGHMILGCKAWHLADPTANHYQRSYWAAASGLPGGANVLTAIGETDCRPDEGIYPLHRKRGGDLADIIGRTVDGFVDFVALVGDNQGLNMNICGVPAPNRARSGEFPLPDQPMASYLDVVARFNGALEAAAARRGYGFVDLYRLTVGEDKASDGSHHLDNTHLLPAVVQQAIASA